MCKLYFVKDKKVLLEIRDQAIAFSNQESITVIDYMLQHELFNSKIIAIKTEMLPYINLIEELIIYLVIDDVIELA